MLPGAAALLLLEEPSQGELLELARRSRLNVACTYKAEPESMTPVLEALRAGANQGVFRVLLVHTMDLPGVSTRRLLAELAALAALRIEVISVREPFLTLRGEQGDLVSWLRARFAAERAGRPLEGGLHAPRKPGRPRAQVPEEDVLRMAGKGMSIRAIARRTGVSASVLQRFLAVHRAAESGQESPIPEVREW